MCALRHLLLAALIAFILIFANPYSDGFAAQPEESAAEDADTAAADRIRRIFSQIESLDDVTVNVQDGVALLEGVTNSAAAATRAEELASAVDGVITVENKIERDVSLRRRTDAVLNEAELIALNILKATPLLLLAMLVFSGIVYLGIVATRWGSFWRRISPNPFLSELAQNGVRFITVLLGAIAAFSLLDAGPLIGAIIGAASVVGIAIGFGLRDIAENYIASVLLSLRQPFLPNDHVSIDGREGRIARVSSRATILVTMDGNQLRIPNAAVFKAVIVNFSTNPCRRFEFEIETTASGDLTAILAIARQALESLDFVLKTPAPRVALARAIPRATLVFHGWIDQRETDFFRARSAALAAAKAAIDSLDSVPAAVGASEKATALDTRPEAAISELVDSERRSSGEADLLTGKRKSE